MQLNSLAVAGLRCFRNPITLKDFDKHINIIFGPNEAGKSTLIRGLILAFCNRHDVGGEDIMAYRPWGTDLSPAINVEFTANGKRYLLEKAFLDQAKSILSEQAADGYLRLAEGKKADERVRDFMLARFPGRGLAKGSDWGLAHLLWMPQDKDRFTSPSVSRQVEDHFRQAAGATLFTRRDDRLVELLNSHYADIYTPKTGRISAKSELHQARMRRRELEERLDLARKKLATIAAKVTELGVRQKQAQDLQKQIKELADKFNRLSEQVEEVKKLKTQISTAEVEEKAAVGRWRSIKQDWDHVEIWSQKGIDAAQAIKEKEKELASLQPIVEKLQQEVVTKQTKVTRLAQEVKQANEQLTRVYKLKQSRSLLTEINKLKKDCTLAQKIEKEILNVRTQLGQRRLPALGDILEAQEQQRTIEICQGQARAQGLQVNFEPVTDFVIAVTTDEGKKEYRVEPEHPLNINATGAKMQLEIATVGTFTIKSGSVELKEIVSQLKTAKGKLAAILTTYQVDNAQDLRAKYDWAQNRQQHITNLRSKLLDLLGEHKTIAQLKRELAVRNEQLSEQCQELGVDADGLQSVPLADANQLEQQTKALQTAYESAQEELKSLEQEQQTQKIRQQTLQQEINEQQRLIDTAGHEQQKCLSNYGGQKEQLYQSLQQAETEKKQKAYVLAQLKERLLPYADGLERTVARLEQELNYKQKEALALREEVAGLRAEINIQSEEGLYSKISELEEEYELVQSRYRWLAGRARAVKLLHRLVHARHEAMLTSITDPIRQGINGLFQQVTAQTDRGLQLEADLSLAGLRISNEESLQPLDVFSIGTQEQMLLLARLALAHFLSANERQLVVLDDALVNSDGHRRRRILGLLEEAAAKHLQIIILTCHPDMYQGLPGKRYDLAALI